MENKVSSSKIIIPVLLSYVVMGFVDIVGVSTGFAKRDFDLSPEMSQLLPSMVFIWFFALSIPVSVVQHNLGKKRVLLWGIFFTALGMFLPFLVYSYAVLLGCFVLLGIGNTIIQVASNPLLQDVVSEKRFSSFMSLSQFIKAISSLLGPLIATFMVAQYGDWKLVFLVYGLISIIVGFWLLITPIKETTSEVKASFTSALKLLKNPFVAFMVFAIFLIVGIDVGINTNIQNLLTQQFGISLEKASLGISIYFGALMITRFIGAILFARINTLKFLLWSSLITALLLLLLVLSVSANMSFALIFLIGLSSGNLFPLIFSLTISKVPKRANEISGLMIMAVVGGAIIPPIMGVLTNIYGVQWSFLVLIISALYIFSTYFKLKD
ncbi:MULTISPECIES: sugar MFS transporter [unclassified Leeuwenhoekiella]|uniref:MFS transporter n=1 Tax=unclassified Leeuwenhoekiella TaxID=2615029 RepID=UPI000C352A26|nr:MULTISPECIES: MFS transporter [unclassified Leeuwenhoekiella]MAW95436.1 MFS transporter [Leeuwenhoekiella sp.]MBA80823.1 MFS transporter [Leeuwenhoekiella sp.]|tara:strand:+ start:42568 stop:43713 length:1146 start_codon:yes stop_codon:yes gene_type:complete